MHGLQKFNLLTFAKGLTTYKVDPMIFCKNIFVSSVVLAIYVNDNLIIGSDTIMDYSHQDFLTSISYSSRFGGAQIFSRHLVCLLARKIGS